MHWTSMDEIETLPDSEGKTTPCATELIDKVMVLRAPEI
jgi:hypothetical protein